MGLLIRSVLISFVNALNMRLNIMIDMALLPGHTSSIFIYVNTEDS